MAPLKPRYRGRKEYALIYCRLIAAAIVKEYVTYDEISKIMFGKPIQGPGMAGHVGYLLGEINENEAKYDRPMLSAVVMGKNNDPGPGFYAFAEELGKLQSNATEEQRTFFLN